MFVCLFVDEGNLFILAPSQLQNPRFAPELRCFPGSPHVHVDFSEFDQASWRTGYVKSGNWDEDAGAVRLWIEQHVSQQQMCWRRIFEWFNRTFCTQHSSCDKRKPVDWNCSVEEADKSWQSVIFNWSTQICSFLVCVL